MSEPIQTPTKGALAKNQKLIEVIRRLNPLLDIRIRYTDPESSPIVKYSDANVVFELPGVADGGGLLEGFENFDTLFYDFTADEVIEKTILAKDTE